MILVTTSKTQTTTALSSAEAEIIAGTEAAKEGRFAANLLSELEGHQIDLVLFCDASAAIGFASRPGLGRVKHLNLRHLWIQEETLAKRLKFKKVKTEENYADLFTKDLTVKFNILRWWIGVRSSHEVNAAEQ